MRQTELQTTELRILRQVMSPAEKVLWQALRDRRLAGLKFRRQVAIGPHTADFYCAAAALVVEADTGHVDLLRDRWMAEHGLLVLRFSAAEILSDLGRCLQRIAAEAGR